MGGNAICLSEFKTNQIYTSSLGQLKLNDTTFQFKKNTHPHTTAQLTHAKWSAALELQEGELQKRLSLKSFWRHHVIVERVCLTRQPRLNMTGIPAIRYRGPSHWLYSLYLRICPIFSLWAKADGLAANFLLQRDSTKFSPDKLVQLQAGVVSDDPPDLT